tara:strand:+ start:246 stop:449 length:204 start_codon:yes stop_codon:yes gene_type:complete
MLTVSYKITSDSIEESDEFTFALEDGKTEENITYQEILDIFCRGTIHDCEENRKGVNFSFWNDQRDW